MIAIFCLKIWSIWNELSKKSYNPIAYALVGRATLVGPEGAGRCSMFSAIHDLAEKR